jgi:uncharacterized membrane protein YkoI
MKTLMIAMICAGALMSTTALAQTQPKLSTQIAQLEAKGYRVIELEAKADWLEAEVASADGQRHELVVDARTGEILRKQADD